ncbi:putative membrane protein [Helicobacter pylori NQ4161]|nr:putative membrane protein [Helicobacter pylori NQ4161]
MLYFSVVFSFLIVLVWGFLGGVECVLKWFLCFRFLEPI